MTGGIPDSSGLGYSGLMEMFTRKLLETFAWPGNEYVLGTAVAVIRSLVP
jgi:hypothetical protein